MLIIPLYLVETRMLQVAWADKQLAVTVVGWQADILRCWWWERKSDNCGASHHSKSWSICLQSAKKVRFYHVLYHVIFSHGSYGQGKSGKVGEFKSTRVQKLAKKQKKIWTVVHTVQNFSSSLCSQIICTSTF